MVNNERAPFDFFVHLEEVGSEQGYFICGQTKYYKTTQLTMEQIEEELKKVNRAMKKARLDNWMLLVITTGQFTGTEEQLPNRCAVVSSRQFEAFFAKPFAERVHFRCTYCDSKTSAGPF